MLGYNQLSLCYLDKTELITLRGKIQGGNLHWLLLYGMLVANRIKKFAWVQSDIEIIHMLVMKLKTVTSLTTIWHAWCLYFGAKVNQKSSFRFPNAKNNFPPLNYWILSSYYTWHSLALLPDPLWFLISFRDQWYLELIFSSHFTRTAAFHVNVPRHLVDITLNE